MIQNGSNYDIFILSYTSLGKNWLYSLGHPYFPMFYQMSSNSFKLDLVNLTPNNIGQVKLLHSKCFPIQYNDHFYAQLLGNADLARLGYVADCLVAAIGCKTESKRMYIMTLGVLEKYRRCGLASQLLDWAIEKARSENLSEVVLHVQTNNSAALEFYKNHHFVVDKTENDYYPQLTPTSAYYLVRRL